MSQRKRYSKQFKLDAVSMVRDQGYSAAQAARNLDLNANMLRRWINESEGDEETVFRGNGKLTAEQAEIRKLREEVRVLKMEKAILKKATVFFAKEMP